jgi:hypothetical protein
MGMRVVEENEKDAFLIECKQAESDLQNREEKLAEVYHKFE